MNDEEVLREAGILVDTPILVLQPGNGPITITPPTSISPDDLVMGFPARNFAGLPNIESTFHRLPSENQEPNWKRIAVWFGAAFLVSTALLLYLVDEVARR
jgi:hypothetical protein